jgi:hypothetical protein
MHTVWPTLFNALYTESFKCHGKHCKNNFANLNNLRPFITEMGS